MLIAVVDILWVILAQLTFGILTPVDLHNDGAH
jgi:hypothetical protein